MGNYGQSKKILLFVTVTLFCLQSCKQSTNSDSETLNESVYVDTTAVIVDTMATTEPENTSTTSYESTHSENNEKLISAFKDMPQTLDADVYKDILTIRVTIIEKAEAQKVAEGIFSEIKKYPENYYIKTVMVVDADYNLLGYASKK